MIGTTISTRYSKPGANFALKKDRSRNCWHFVTELMFPMYSTATTTYTFGIIQQNNTVIQNLAFNTQHR